MSLSLTVALVFGWKNHNKPENVDCDSYPEGYVVGSADPMDCSDCYLVYAKGSYVEVATDYCGYSYDNPAICIPKDLPATDDFLLQLRKVPDTLRPSTPDTQPCWILWSHVG